jgi:thioredoxin-related protein
MKALSIIAAVLLLAVTGPAHAETARGQMKGGIGYSLPPWFQSSFLDFKHDVEEARKQGRHVMVFLHLEECPYCARMLKENFTGGETRDFIRKNFDVIGVNIRGDVETVWIDGATYTERALAGHLKVYATPTIVFVGLDGKKVLQLTGYRDPRAFRHALEYVQSQSYRRQPFAEYVAAREKQAVYAFREHPQFANRTNFKGYKQPFAILFEDKQCGECARFHEKTLNHPDVLAELKKFLVVRLDADSTQSIVDLDGNATTPAQWVRALDISYRPAVVLFDEGREIFRIDNRLYRFHFKETLRYVSGGYYKRYDDISKYNAARRDELLGQGIDIDYAE